MSIQEPRLANIDQAGFLELTAQEPYHQSSFFVYVALAILKSTARHCRTRNGLWTHEEGFITEH